MIFKQSVFDAVETALHAALNAQVTRLFEVLMTAREDSEAAYDRFMVGMRKTIKWYDRIRDDLEKADEELDQGDSS